MSNQTLCILGCGNIGTPILKGLINALLDSKPAQFSKFIACVHSAQSEQRLTALFPAHQESGTLTISRGDNLRAIQNSDVVILSVDPADVRVALGGIGIPEALEDKLLISVVAGWTPIALEHLILPPGPSPLTSKKPTWIIRALPNIAAQVSQSLTAIQNPYSPAFPAHHLATADAIFSLIGKTMHIAPRLMDATTAVAGSTPAFFAIICDAFVDAAVAVGLPRDMAQAQIYQSMRGTAEMLQSGMQPGELRDQGTSPEGCTMGGVMVMEEAGVRGHLGRALREAVTVARAMGRGGEHVNDTRRADGKGLDL